MAENVTEQNSKNLDYSHQLLRGADFRAADLAGASFVQAELTDADFFGANLRGARFFASDPQRTTLPLRSIVMAASAACATAGLLGMAAGRATATETAMYGVAYLAAVALIAVAHLLSWRTWSGVSAAALLGFAAAYAFEPTAPPTAFILFVAAAAAGSAVVRLSRAAGLVGAGRSAALSGLGATVAGGLAAALLVAGESGWLAGSVALALGAGPVLLLSVDAIIRGGNSRRRPFGAHPLGTILDGARLAGADLRDTDLRWAILQGADLSGADLRGADCRGADFTGADLTDALTDGWLINESTILFGMRNMQAFVESETAISS